MTIGQNTPTTDKPPVLSETQRHIIAHSLGVDRYGQGSQYRNHFVTGQDSNDGQVILSLVERGLMEDLGATCLMSGWMNTYRVTEAGRRLFFATCPRPPKKTRGQLRYELFLKVSDCISDLTFREFLRRESEFLR